MSKKIRIYAMTHKDFTPPQDAIYIPMQVRSDRQIEREYPVMDAEDISEFNPYYSELTGMYRVFRTDNESDIIGICHYRRYLQNAAGRLFNAQQIEQILSRYDVMTTKKVILDHSYLEGFGGKHNREDLLQTGRVILELRPNYYEEFERVIHQNTTYFGNMIITDRKHFMEYSLWLFTILFEVHKRVDMTGYNDYQKRLFGFLSELLLMVYINVNRLSVYECDVAVIGEKKETAETRKVIEEFFLKRDLEGAKAYFMEVYRKRPDILMEASDTLGELKLCTQMLATFAAETEQTGKNYLEHENRLSVLLLEFRELNRILLQYDTSVSVSDFTMEEQQWLLSNGRSPIAVDIARMILYPKEKIQ